MVNCEAVQLNEKWGLINDGISSISIATGRPCGDRIRFSFSLPFDASVAVWLGLAAKTIRIRANDDWRIGDARCLLALGIPPTRGTP